MAVSGGRGDDTVVSDTGGIDCGPGVASSTCSAQVPVDDTVTLTAEPAGGDTFTTEYVLAMEFEVASAPPFGSLSATFTVQPGNNVHVLDSGNTQYTGALELPAGTPVTNTVQLENSDPSVTWGGACASASGSTCTFTTDGNKTVSAGVS